MACKTEPSSPHRSLTHGPHPLTPFFPFLLGTPLNGAILVAAGPFFQKDPLECWRKRKNPRNGAIVESRCAQRLVCLIFFIV